MKRYILYMLWALCLTKVQGQGVTVVQPIFATGSNPTFVRLLSATLINNSPTEQRIFLKVTLTKEQDQVLYAKTADFNLPAQPSQLILDQYTSGPLLFPLKDVNADPGVGQFVAMTSTLPPGSYDFCIEVLPSSSPNSPSIGQSCTSVTYEYFTAVNLLTPTNQGTHPNALPVLTWSMSSGNAASLNSTYGLRIVQLLPNQSPQAAMQSNPAIFSEDRLVANLLQYPVTSQPLLPCSTYAWQVIAYQGTGNQRRTLATSEVWTFKIACGTGGGLVGLPIDHANPTGGGGGGGVGNVCLTCDSVICSNYKLELKRIRKDTISYYQIWLDNTYTGPDAEFQPRSFTLTVGTDSISVTPDSLSNKWNLGSGVATTSKSQAWKVKATRIQQGKSKPGIIRFSGPSTDRITVFAAWKNKKDVVICRDTLDVFEPVYYFDLNGPQANVVQETAEKKLRVQFHNPYAASPRLDVKIYDLAMRQLLNPSSNQFSDQGTLQGLNRIAIDLKRYQLSAGKTYLLEVTDHMSHFQMKFKPISSNPSNL